MAYWLDIYRFPNSTEYEYKWVGNYGAKGEKRKKKIKPTPEQMRKQNQRNRENNVRRLIKANFFQDDLWVTLKYEAGKRKPIGEVKKDFNNFLESLRGKYKRRKSILKFIYRIEIGKRGGIHIHLVVPRIRGEDTDLLVQKSWKHGRANFESIYELGGYEKLASYIVKRPDEEIEEQLSLFTEEERKDLIRYSSSRNLIRPAPERKEYKRRTLKKLIEEGMKASEGFWIDKNSIYQGTNPFTGFSYLHYTECRIKTIESREEWEKYRKGGGRDG
ncbi:MAG: hypothetical protein MR992_00350 [Lachnospiraceae bacterium]|nr:hypothetical protein [Lachnospiraceae bacterium]MDD7627834.1 hypothetical protein [Lachnospiraceae bacterium]MDY4118792.1 hypothetical protein [Lachnospiraceae bacterium]